MLHASQLRPLHESAQQRFLICLFVYLFIYSFFHYRHIGYGIRASTMFFMRTRNNTTKCVVQQDNLFLVLVCLRHSLWILHDYAPWLHAFVLCFGFPVYVRYVIPTSVEEGLKKKKKKHKLLAVQNRKSVSEGRNVRAALRSQLGDFVPIVQLWER